MKNQIIDIVMILGFAAFFFGFVSIPNPFPEKHPHIEPDEIVEPKTFPILEPVESPSLEILTPIKKEPEFEWITELRRICSCESNGHPGGEPIHHDIDGTVLLGRINPLDVGMCQINLKYHGARAESLGIDLYSKSGNFEYASMLYREQGSTPWNWSRHCWSE